MTDLLPTSTGICRDTKRQWQATTALLAFWDACFISPKWYCTAAHKRVRSTLGLYAVDAEMVALDALGWPVEEF